MDALDHSDEEASSSGGGSRSGFRFGARKQRRRSGTGSHQHLLLMDCVGGGDGDGAREEAVPLPDYERLSQSARLPDDDPDLNNPPPPEQQLVPEQPQQQKQAPSPLGPLPPPSPPTQRQKPAAWRLIEYVRSRNRAGGAASDGDSKSSDGEKDGVDVGEEGKMDRKKKKKRSSWLPDPERRWPVQGFY